MQAEHLLIQKIASRPSTEELLFFIAEDEAITSACSALQKKIAGNNKKELEKINALCQKYHISLVYLSRELNHIQNIFAPRETISDDHKLLDLQAGASIAEVKQAYRRLSIKYHPDTSDKKNTEKFIEITKAYQRIITSTDKKENNAPPSSSAWRYRKNTPPPPHQQRKKKYLYLFSFVTGAVVLVIVGISMHYQKRAMLKNISMITPKPFPKKPLVEKTPGIVKEHSTETYVSESSTPAAVQPQVIEQEQFPLPTNKISEQLSHQVHQDDIALVPLTPESMSHVQPPSPDMRAEAEVENFNTLSSFPDIHFISEDASTQKSDQVEEKSIVRTEEHSNFFSAVLDQEKPAEIKATVPAAIQQISKQNETSSIFSEARYHKTIIVQPKERKIRKENLPSPDAEQTPHGMSAQDSLQKFVQSYTAAYMSRDVQKFTLFFTAEAQENGQPFSERLDKYKQLFNATQSIDYSIDLLGIDIQGEGGVNLTGRFKVQLIYSPDEIKSSTGTITFFLIKVENNYLIKALTYYLDPKW